MPSFNEDSKNNTFGFGKKYKHFKIEEVPDRYLEWVLENCNAIDNYLTNRIKTELMRRVKLGIAVTEKDSDFIRGRYWHKDEDAWSNVDDGLPF